MSDQEDGPPPLEDMTEELEKMGRLGGPLPQAKSVNSRTLNEKDSHVSKGSAKENISQQKSGTEAPSKLLKTDNNDGGFCGFQKGFLFGSKPSNLSSSRKKEVSSKVFQGKEKKGVSLKNEDDIIHPKSNGNKEGLVFAEVQEAMKETKPLLETGKWLTDDLLNKIEEDPVLSEGLRDPNMMHYLNLLQTDPKQALAATKGNSKLQKFMESFCSLMGNHLSTLEESSSERANPEPAIMSEEEAKVKTLTSNPEVKAVLMDPQIVKLMHLLKTDPPAAQRLLVESRSTDLDSKIQILLKNGLLSLQ